MRPSPPQATPSAQWDARRAQRRILAAAAALTAALAILMCVQAGVTADLDRRLLTGLHEGLDRAGVAAGARGFFDLVAAATRPALLPLALVVLVAMALLRRGDRLGAVAVGIGFAGGEVIEVLGKQVIARPRPRLFAGIDPPSGFAFPSGHATAAVCGVLLPALMLAPTLSPSWRRTVIALACVTVVLVDMSRLVLVAHWPTDVVAGNLIGAAWALGVSGVLTAWAHRGHGRTRHYVSAGGEQAR